MIGFRVKKGLLSHTEALPRDRVQAVGADALTIAGAEAINEEARYPEMSSAKSLGDVHGTKVVTESGSMVGTVSELEVDDLAQTVLTYSLQGSLLDKLRGEHAAIQPGEVLRLGQGGIMIVTDAAAQRLESAE